MMKMPEIERMESLIKHSFDAEHEYDLDYRTNYGFVRGLCIKELKDRIRRFVEENDGRFDNFVQVGIGGSALGATASLEFLNGIYMNYKRNKRYFVLDNIDPERLELVLSLPLERTLFHVVSKSGSTIETISQFSIILKALKRELSGEFRRNLVFTTSTSGLLFEFAKREGIECFFIPEEVGGRYSVFTSVGLLPIAFFENDIERFLEGGKTAVRAFRNGWDFPNRFASFAIGEYEKNSRNMLVMFAYKDGLYAVSDWFRQLWAESLGKDGKGQTPIKALGVTDQHSQLQLYQDGPKDKVIVFLDAPSTSEFVIDEPYGFDYLKNVGIGKIMRIEKESTQRALRESGAVCGDIMLTERGEFAIGALFASFMLATAKAGEILGVNPFDQPGVELGKRYTKEALKNG